MLKKLLSIMFLISLLCHLASATAYPISQKKKIKLPPNLVNQMIEDNDLDALLYDQYKGKVRQKLSHITKVKKADLNGDKDEEYLLLVNNGALCGSGGCTLWIYHKQSNSYQALHPINDESVLLYDLETTSIKVMKTSTNGYFDLECFEGSKVSYQGIEKILLKFNGKRYARVSEGS